jgi:hypothetical protein
MNDKIMKLVNLMTDFMLLVLVVQGKGYRVHMKIQLHGNVSNL